MYENTKCKSVINVQQHPGSIISHFKHWCVSCAKMWNEWQLLSINDLL